MKSMIVTLIAMMAISANAQSQKDRGGGEVPYAIGTSSVTLSWRHTQSLVQIEGKSAELLYRSLKVAEGPDSSPFARLETKAVKQKDNVKCYLIESESAKIYRCDITLQN